MRNKDAILLEKAYSRIYESDIPGDVYRIGPDKYPEGGEVDVYAGFGVKIANFPADVMQKFTAKYGDDNVHGGDEIWFDDVVASVNYDGYGPEEDYSGFSPARIENIRVVQWQLPHDEENIFRAQQPQDQHRMDLAIQTALEDYLNTEDGIKTVEYYLEKANRY